MDQSTNTNQPPPPPANEPADIFSDSDAAAASTQNVSREINQNGYEAIDFESVNEQLGRFIEYVQETRSDLEAGGTSQGWIDQLFAQLKETLSAVRSFEIDHADDMTQRNEGPGLTSEVLLREVDPENFDRVTTQFDAAGKMFEDYFEKHRAVKLGLK